LASGNTAHIWQVEILPTLPTGRQVSFLHCLSKDRASDEDCVIELEFRLPNSEVCVGVCVCVCWCVCVCVLVCVLVCDGVCVCVGV